MDNALGIVLSGGGLRGIAHIGVLQALDENGIRPDCVAGTSTGAIVGALYGAGYSAQRMLEFFETKSPFRLSRLTLRKPGIIDTAKVVADFREYFPEDRFEALRIRLFLAATDIVNATLRIFDSGPLIAAILASCSVPMIFTPTEIDGRWYSDGGIINNFPVEPIKPLCGPILGVYASPLRIVHQSDLRSSLDVSQRAFEVGMYFGSRAKFEQCDFVVCPSELSRFATFDTKPKHVEEVYAIGYRAAVDSMDAIRRVLQAKGCAPSVPH
jgi:NTE family protein